MPTSTYIVALGSNRRGRHGAPNREIAAALGAIGGLMAASPIIASAAVGPSIRRFANAVAMIETRETPLALLARLQSIERDFGRRPGRRWGARVIDLDIVLWSGGIWASAGLTIPHPGFRERAFVLKPLAKIAADWRDPVTGRTVRQLAAMVDRHFPRPRVKSRSPQRP